MACCSAGVPYLPSAEANSCCSSGRNSFRFSMIVPTFQMKMPEFQKNSPLSMKILAISRFGFSVKVLTLRIAGRPSTGTGSIWI